MRILLALTLLGMTAGCVMPPEAAAPPPPIGLAPTPGPVALAPAPAPLPEPVTAVYVPNPLGWLFAGFAPQAPTPGRLALSNFTYDGARVQAVITPYPDCQERGGTAVSDFEIPLNGTRVIAALPGADVCWRRALPPGAPPTAAMGAPGWSEWNRVFTSSGRAIDSKL